MQVETHLSSNDFVDHRLVGSFTAEGMKDFIRLALQCMVFPGKRRPKMEMVVSELDRILEKEITLTTVMDRSTSNTAPSVWFGCSLMFWIRKHPIVSVDKWFEDLLCGKLAKESTPELVGYIFQVCWAIYKCLSVQ